MKAHLDDRDRIEILLHHYRDVLEGIHERRGTEDDILALMCRDWNHPSYQRLELLLGQMRGERPRLWLNVRRKYLEYQEVRRALCRRCGLRPANEAGRVHSHPPGKAVTLRPVVVRVPGEDLVESAVEEAIGYLHALWGGPVDLSPGVAAIEAQVRLRDAA